MTGLKDPALLEAALEGLEGQRQRIDQQIREVQAMLGRRKPRSSAAAVGADSGFKASGGQKRQLSEAARKRIAAAQKKRWAEYRKAERQQKQD